ncbi:MAG: hypothetical protein GY754_24905 [bacterium]|nr:hypothetical protein [bacterium]
MLQKYIKVGKEKMSIDQFVHKVRNYDVELTRMEVLNVIDDAKQSHPADVPAILNAVKSAYHISIAF